MRIIRAGDFNDWKTGPLGDAWIDLDSVMMVHPPMSETQRDWQCDVVLSSGYRGQFPLSAERLVELIKTYVVPA